jgi:hypothetical protein
MVINRVLSMMALSVICLLFLANPAVGTDWRFVGKSADGNVSVSVDVDSIKWVSEDIVRCFQKFSYAKPKLLNTSQKPVTKVIAYRDWNCGEETYNDLKVIFYYSDGTKGAETYKYALWHQIKQNSPEDDLHEYVCTYE